MFVWDSNLYPICSHCFWAIKCNGHSQFFVLSIVEISSKSKTGWGSTIWPMHTQHVISLKCRLLYWMHLVIFRISCHPHPFNPMVLGSLQLVIFLLYTAFEESRSGLELSPSGCVSSSPTKCAQHHSECKVTDLLNVSIGSRPPLALPDLQSVGKTVQTWGHKSQIAFWN